MSLTEHPFAPVPAIVQEQQLDWDQRIDRIAQLAKGEDFSALEMGDHFAAIEQSFSADHVRKAADQAGVPWNTARSRLWVAKAIPKGNPLRKTHLTFGHLKVLAGVPPETLQEWAKKAIAENLSVHSLVGAIDAQGCDRAVEQGDPCIQCEEPLSGETEVVSFQIGRHKRARCCSTVCAANYFQELCQNAT